VIVYSIPECNVPVAGQGVAGQGRTALSSAILFYFTSGTD